MWLHARQAVVWMCCVSLCYPSRCARCHVPLFVRRVPSGDPWLSLTLWMNEFCPKTCFPKSSEGQSTLQMAVYSLKEAGGREGPSPSRERDIWHVCLCLCGILVSQGTFYVSLCFSKMSSVKASVVLPPCEKKVWVVWCLRPSRCAGAGKPSRRPVCSRLVLHRRVLRQVPGGGRGESRAHQVGLVYVN